ILKSGLRLLIKCRDKKDSSACKDKDPDEDTGEKVDFFYKDIDAENSSNEGTDENMDEVDSSDENTDKGIDEVDFF
ncbi:1518_t:CDS:2, partial [Racocetra persica]